jgi:hypothetical protein
MLVPEDFARRKYFTALRGREYIRRVEHTHGSSICAYGMVLGSELQSDATLTSSRELHYDQYVHFAAGLSSLHSHGTKRSAKVKFIRNLHVIEDLPCDINFSNELISENQVFSRFKGLFQSKPADPSSEVVMTLNDHLLFMRCRKPRLS